MSNVCPDDCVCHSYLAPGRTCSWCQQENHEDENPCSCVGLVHTDECGNWTLPA